MSRFAVSGLVHKYISHTGRGFELFPWGTLSVNLAGSFLIGFLWALFEGVLVSPAGRSFFLVGFLGSFTTFSTYSLETFHLFRDGETKLALLNLVFNNIGCIFFVFTGFFVFKFFFRS